jgi:hypothetical protein
METTPERQQLEHFLQDEPAGSPKIQALADYAMLKEIKYQIETMTLTDEVFDLRIRRVVLELAIDQQRFSKNVHAYFETFDKAGEILALYFEKHADFCKAVLNDLKDINRQKRRQNLHG